MAWILQMEDQRILTSAGACRRRSSSSRQRRNAPPPPAPVAPDLTKLTSDNDTRIRRRAALAIGRVGLKEGIPSLSALLADADADVRQAAAFALGLIGDAVGESGADSAAARIPRHWSAVAPQRRSARSTPPMWRLPSARWRRSTVAAPP